MKWLIASDIHGSAYYCEKLIKAYAEENPDRILLLGDVLYHGPRNDLPRDYSPKRVIDLLNSLSDSILCVRGNCEAEVDQMVLKFPVLADYAVIDCSDYLIYATHGHIYNAKNLPPMRKNDILLHGHTHIPACEKCEDIVYINPGSVSIPKENSHHGYIIFENDKFLFKNLDFEVINSYTHIR